MGPEDFNVQRHDLGHGYTLVTGEIAGTKVASIFHAQKKGSRTKRDVLWTGKYADLQGAVAKVARERMN